MINMFNLIYFIEIKNILENQMKRKTKRKIVENQWKFRKLKRNQ